MKLDQAVSLRPVRLQRSLLLVPISQTSLSDYKKVGAQSSVKIAEKGLQGKSNDYNETNIEPVSHRC